MLLEEIWRWISAQSSLELLAALIIIAGPILTVVRWLWNWYKKPRLNVTVQKHGSLGWIIQNTKGKRPAKNLSLLVNYQGSKWRLFYKVNLSESDEIIVEFRFSSSIYPGGAFWIASNIPQSIEKNMDHGGSDWGPIPIPMDGKSDFELFFSGGNLRRSESKQRKYRLFTKDDHHELLDISEPSRKAVLWRSIRSVSFSRFPGKNLG